MPVSVTTTIAPYDPIAIEEKWQQLWEEQRLFLGTQDQKGRDKMYLLFAFAYPSGSGLHVGHVESKTALDILARYYRMNGKDVFFPVGWDAFGLPAENYAIKTGIHPAETTKNAIDTFRRQIKRLAISYDWDNEIATSHPGYYRWTQWLFLMLYEKGLAYQATAPVNWCPSCQTVLANEQVVDGQCERCGSEVVQKEMKQWFFKITQYRDELISGLDEVDWPRATKEQQLNWIGRSEGARVTFASPELKDELIVFTTAHDTIFGCTFMVVAPEHDFLQKHRAAISNWNEVAAYIEAAAKKTELQRQIQKEKTGVKVDGITFTNPATGKQVPLFVADYVLGSYGTGAIMAVPGQDERDAAFAKKFGLEFIYTATREKGVQPTEFTNYSEIKQDRTNHYLINSGEFNGLNYIEGRVAILEFLEKKGAAVAFNEYKLRDWLISRQRYWGAPIPVIYDPEGNAHPVKESGLPWLLPTDVDFKPTGESPLTSSAQFLKAAQDHAAEAYADLIKEKGWDAHGQGWRPEFDTMDTFVDSSWYFLRYVSARDESTFADQEQLAKWLPVDFYMIGPEHIVLHLLYSRFFTKFLRDEGYLNFGEPFMKMRHQGMILGPDHKKMSKSKGNVINPDDVIEKFGADTLRVYEMFMGPIEADKPWNTRAVAGVYRFLTRVHRLVQLWVEADKAAAVGGTDVVTPVQRKLHQTIRKVSQDIPALKFNTAIASMMEFVNEWEAAASKTMGQDNNKNPITREEIVNFIKIIAPFAPFIADDLYQLVEVGGLSEGKVKSIHTESWAIWDDSKAVDELVIIPVQINGKVRAQLEVTPVMAQDETEVVAKALAIAKVQEWMVGQRLRKQIYIPGKILNLVIG